MPTPSPDGRRSSSIRDASLALARVASRRFVAPHEAFGGRGGSSKDGGSSKESSADGSKYGGNDPVLRQLLRRDNEAPRARVVQRVVTLDRVVLMWLLAAGARPDLKDRWGNNAAQECRRAKHWHLTSAFK